MLKSRTYQGSAATLATGRERSSCRTGKRKDYLPGTRIRAEDIALWHYALGMSPEQIIDRHPALSTAAIEAALAFYRENHSDVPLAVQPADALASRPACDSARFNQRSR